MTWLRWLPAGLVLLPWLLGPIAPSSDARIRAAASAVSFRLLDWETLNLSQRAGRLWTGLFGSRPADDQDAAATFGAYLRTRADRPAAELALERLVANAYQEQGITRSVPLVSDRLFPPVLVALTAPPNVLVIAPRTELRVLDSVVLKAMDVVAQEQLEASADSSGVVSLVAPIGGLATYPSMVLDQDSPERVVSAAAHEWLHQYLIFYPLGAHYWDTQEAREINETMADMVGQEIGATVMRRYQLRPARMPTTTGPGETLAFDFRAFMRETRLRTEQLLAAGQVDEAEAYMRGRRVELQSQGYTIRKLNQAYFALYGSYGGGFAASPRNPIPELLRQLRERSSSLGDFVFAVRVVTSVAELQAAFAHLADPAG
jgi:hypothetical protein